MSHVFNPVALAACIVLSVGATTTASAEWLGSNSEVSSLVNGKRVYLATPFGGEFPLYYKSNGRVSGDGTVLGLGRYFSPTETGKWWVEDAQLCQQFPTWYKGKVSCFKLRPTGETKLRWRRDDGYSGRARVEG